MAERATVILSELGLENVHVVVGDGTLGLAAHAPYDAIIVTAAGPRVPPALREQLATGGRMVIPTAAAYGQELLLIEKLPAAATPEAAPAAGAGGERGDAVPEANPPGAPEPGALPSRFRETTILGCTFVPLIGAQGYSK